MRVNVNGYFRDYDDTELALRNARSWKEVGATVWVDDHILEDCPLCGIDTYDCSCPPRKWPLSIETKGDS